jgi:DNA repair ATPase RecN
MTEANIQINYDSILNCVEKLRSEGRSVNIRSIRDELGARGSFTTIQPILKQVLANTPLIPPETEDSLRPIVNSISNKIRETVLKATNELKKEKENIQKDLDEATTNLINFEKLKLDYETELTEMKNEITRRTVKLEAAESLIDNLGADIKEIRKESENQRIELANLKFHEESWKSHETELKSVKNELVVVKEKAAYLEGRLKERLLHQNLTEVQKSSSSKINN